ncbi:hypothetical protein MMAN_27050 [Mycobacterium mantenii]|uniref:Uncharacterized protein n=1 Tax=Mycobacterium mantenii TaxID=560555 RepID=A0ABM7JSQ0_MYCNT|nr:hypothetical protein MMAN_27050 [Mycobacterium mantenii]
MTCANARADILGRPLLSVGGCPASDMVKNRFGDLFRRARISSLLQMAFPQANVPVGKSCRVAHSDRILGCRPIASPGIMQAGCLRRSVPFGGPHAVHRAARVELTCVVGAGGHTDRTAEQHRRERNEVGG